MIYDHECTGESNFGDPIINNTKDVLFSHWIQDVHAVIDQLTEGPIVLVGCSMGGKKNLKTLLVINVQLLREVEPKDGLISKRFLTWLPSSKTYTKLLSLSLFLLVA